MPTCFSSCTSLAVESKAGKLGTIAIFVTLGLGIFGFVAKEVITLVISV
ncbi:MAG: DUF2788 domain-containing protein [Gammaproteobacteria bacterium]